MAQKIDELVSVECLFDKDRLLFFPRKVLWKNRVYRIIKIGLHHEYKKGDVLFHIFSVTTTTASNLFLRLKFNTKNLNWHLEEVSGGI